MRYQCECCDGWTTRTFGVGAKRVCERCFDAYSEKLIAIYSLPAPRFDMSLRYHVIPSLRRFLPKSEPDFD